MKILKNVEAFGELLNDRSQKVAGAYSASPLSFGLITADMGLKLDNFPDPIPKGDYLVCRSLTIGEKDSDLIKTKPGQGTHGHGPGGGHSQYTGDGIHSHPNSEGAHVHDILVPEILQSLKAGDHVLAAWVGTEPVVIDIVKKL